MVTRDEPDLDGDIASVRERVRGEARSALGVTGDDNAPSLIVGVRDSGVGWYPLVAVSGLALVSGFPGYAIAVLGPEIAAGLGISKSALAGAVLLKTLAMMVAVAPVAAFVQRRPRRALVSVGMALAWALVTVSTGYVISIWGLVFLLAADGALTGSVYAVHQPLVVDSYPPGVRFRALAFYRASQSVGDMAGPAIIGICYLLLDLTWRGAFVALGFVSLIAGIHAIRLRDPGFGRWDTERVRDLVRGGEIEEHAAERLELGFFEIARRLLMIGTIRRILVGFSVLGMLLVPYTTYLSFFLQERWGMGPADRAIFTACMPIFAMVALAGFGRRGEAMFRRDPGQMMRYAGLTIGIGVTTVALAIFSPMFPFVVILIGVSTAMFALLAPMMNLAMFGIVRASMRPHIAALSGIAFAAVGGVGGLVLLDGVDRRFGTGGAIVSLAVPGILAGIILCTAGRTIGGDLDAMVDELVEEEEIHEIANRGERLPLLACRHLDFSYGPMQVLFDVDFTLDEGEMVALLGTNGAGKSTLLRVISGLELPSRGSVRLRGADITFVDCERRVSQGIVQIPGGKAVFGPLTVAENLKVLGYTQRHDRRRVEAGLDACFESFPRLAARRNSLASTLSGGEQQMLALATAFILQPRLLLIDELSLGLAPRVVSELLQMVRAINAEGTAVVIVEQSVNVALSVADHAYFMEKGEIRFDGPAADLLGRPDLLRSVFLEGAAAGAV